jgi:hypothetical protein
MYHAILIQERNLSRDESLAVAILALQAELDKTSICSQRDTSTSRTIESRRPGSLCVSLFFEDEVWSVPSAVGGVIFGDDYLMSTLNATPSFFDQDATDGDKLWGQSLCGGFVMSKSMLELQRMDSEKQREEKVTEHRPPAGKHAVKPVASRALREQQQLTPNPRTRKLHGLIGDNCFLSILLETKAGKLMGDNYFMSILRTESEPNKRSGRDKDRIRIPVQVSLVSESWCSNAEEWAKERRKVTDGIRNRRLGHEQKTVVHKIFSERQDVAEHKDLRRKQMAFSALLKGLRH